ncbi:MAG TPA: hypothetical protein DCY94_01165 [Firmicutes bacterium]|nr:hypothetical protein [Bacillota bacterium]
MDKSQQFKSLRYSGAIKPDMHEFICVNNQDEGLSYFAGTYDANGVREKGFRELENDSWNDYRVVQFYNGLFGYKHKNNIQAYPLRFLIASEFDDHGLAMVGFNGGVSFIDESFNILTRKGWKFLSPRVLLAINNENRLLPIEIERILGDESVIARVFFGDTSLCLGIDHKILGLPKESPEVKCPDEVVSKGYEIQEKGVLFEDGRFYTWSDLGRIAIEQYPNFLSLINSRSEKIHTLQKKR